jgi:hypothetical protein
VKAEKVGRPTRGRGGEERTRSSRQSNRGAQRHHGDAPPRRRGPAPDKRPQRSAPQTGPVPRPGRTPARPKNADQAKARAKARKAKAPKVIKPPLRERLLVKLASIEFNPRSLVARVPFVVLVIGALGLGLCVTLWLSTGSAQRSYQLGSARQVNEGLLQQKEALERDVLEAQAAPALAESARDLGMIPSRDTAHLVQDPAGNWIVVGTPKPAEGVSPPPLNSPLPEEAPPPPPPAPAPKVVDPRELTVRMPGREALPAVGALPGATPGALPGATPGDVPHALPGQVPALGPAVPPAPAADVLAAPPVNVPVAPPVDLTAAPAADVPVPDAAALHLPDQAAPPQPGPPTGAEQFTAVAAPVAGPPA